MGVKKSACFFTERRQILRSIFLFFPGNFMYLKYLLIIPAVSVDTLRLMALICHLKSLNSCADVLVKNYLGKASFFFGMGMSLLYTHNSRLIERELKYECNCVFCGSAEAF